MGATSSQAMAMAWGGAAAAAAAAAGEPAELRSQLSTDRASFGRRWSVQLGAQSGGLDYDSLSVLPADSGPAVLGDASAEPPAARAHMLRGRAVAHFTRRLLGALG